MTAQLFLKQGDTFRWSGTFTEWTGSESGELRCDVRDAYDRILGVAEITAGADPDEFVFTVPGEVTETWPEGWVYTDVERAVSGLVQSTETISIYVYKDVTK